MITLCCPSVVRPLVSFWLVVGCLPSIFIGIQYQRSSKSININHHERKQFCFMLLETGLVFGSNFIYFSIIMSCSVQFGWQMLDQFGFGFFFSLFLVTPYILFSIAISINQSINQSRIELSHFQIVNQFMNSLYHGLLSSFCTVRLVSRIWSVAVFFFFSVPIPSGSTISVDPFHLAFIIGFLNLFFYYSLLSSSITSVYRSLVRFLVSFLRLVLPMSSDLHSFIHWHFIGFLNLLSVHLVSYLRVPRSFVRWSAFWLFLWLCYASFLQIFNSFTLLNISSSVAFSLYHRYYYFYYSLVSSSFVLGFVVWLRLYFFYLLAFSVPIDRTKSVYV
jgi:hypothetical protein